MFSVLRGICQNSPRLGCMNLVSVATNESVAPAVRALPILEPLYLTLTTPLAPKRSEPRPGEHIVMLDATVFRHPIRRDILHLCVTHHLDCLRQGSAKTKTRAEVRGSGVKIRPQKGSGKARLGDGQSPMLRGGGVAFGPKPRDFSTRLPRKVIAMGMRVALSTKVKENRLGVVARLDWPNGKTKHLSHRIDELGWRKTLLVVGDEVSETMKRAIRNIPTVDWTTPDKLTIYDVVKWPRVIMDIKALEYFEQTLGKGLPTLH